MHEEFKTETYKNEGLSQSEKNPVKYLTPSVSRISHLRSKEAYFVIPLQVLDVLKRKYR